MVRKNMIFLRVIFYSGCLQGDGLLVIFDKEIVDPSFELAVEAIHAIGEVNFI